MTAALRCAIFGLMLACAPALLAQPVQISGTVYDAALSWWTVPETTRKIESVPA